MDVFGIAASAGEAMRDAAIEAARELGVFDALIAAPRPLAAVADAIGVTGGRARLRALLDVLAAIGTIARRGDGFAASGPAPAPREVVRAGWGLLAEVIRTNRPIAAGDAARFHAHLVAAGAAAARELAPLLGAGPLLDLGGGAGAYTAGFLDARPEASAILVDAPAVVALAAEELARFGARVTLVAGDARTVALGDRHGAVLLANVLHLHPPDACAALCAAAARAVAPDGVVVVKDLCIDVDRAGPLEALLFALNMALYTEAGDVYESARVRGWLAAAGLIEIRELRLASAPDSSVWIARRELAAPEIDSALVGTGEAAWRELAEAGTLRSDAVAPKLAFPTPLRRQLARAFATERMTPSSPTALADLERHYLDVVPRMRIAQLASTAEPGATLFHIELAWSRLPRLAAALDRLFATLDGAGADAGAALGAASATQFRARTPTLAALHARTHYGGAMPLLYGYPADLASFHARGAAAGLDVHATIDRYLTAPIIHELCHFAPDRAALEPLHLDECVGGWLGVYVHPEFAYPAPGCDDALYAAPWLAQVGQAIARAFGIAEVVRAHAGMGRWDAGFVAAAERLGRDDWHSRRTLHLLSDTFAPAPWVALALLAGAGRSLAGETLASLAATPLAELTLRDDPDFDRAIATDALRAMCLVNARLAGTFCVRTAAPAGPIEIDAITCRVFAARGAIDPIAPSYWLPPPVAARLGARGLAGYTLHLDRVDALSDIAAAICEASPGFERDGVTLIARPLAPGLA